MKNLQIIQTLEIEKNKFLDEKHLDWYVQTYIRNYPEFLENDYNNAMTLAKQHIDDYEQLTQYIVDLIMRISVLNHIYALIENFCFKSSHHNGM